MVISNILKFLAIKMIVYINSSHHVFAGALDFKMLSEILKYYYQILLEKFGCYLQLLNAH